MSENNFVAITQGLTRFLRYCPSKKKKIPFTHLHVQTFFMIDSQRLLKLKLVRFLKFDINYYLYQMVYSSSIHLKNYFAYLSAFLSSNGRLILFFRKVRSRAFRNSQINFF